MKTSVIVGIAILVLLSIAVWSSANILIVTDEEIKMNVVEEQQEPRIVNPYFQISNSTDDIMFKVDHEANIYTPQMVNCSLIKTDEEGRLICSPDAPVHFQIS